ncbi:MULTISPECIES: hypothetical protein [Ochrobactrum]|uniref:Uncharacterized protein n=1 Tax=Ochrobactrum soli TaxID=2448455 RepID=A0A2P9HQW6_9HYPH|nr:hypothetical protein [[Ochrobactrum] soli]WHT41946.1 hypothetical protein QLQ11_11360 [Ochrobactrum sp. SSR]SPL66160.1 hypothetical protein OHAE_2027 [[Ochrobactrum] soli]
MKAILKNVSGLLLGMMVFVCPAHAADVKQSGLPLDFGALAGDAFATAVSANGAVIAGRAQTSGGISAVSWAGGSPRRPSFL